MMRFQTGIAAALLTVSPTMAQMPANFGQSSGSLAAPYGTAGSLIVGNRSLAARAADTFNVLDFGALGDGAGATIGAGLAPSLAAFAASAPGNAWAMNPAFGLTFTMAASAAQDAPGISLTFLEPLASGPLGWVTTGVALWQDPQNGNDLLQAGMLVSGSCIANGTTVAGVGRAPAAAGYGTVTLSQPTSSACPAGTPVTFTIAPAQLQALTLDWLGWQSAAAAAWLRSSTGGTVYAPAGSYVINHPIINAGGITDAGATAPALDMRGAGPEETRLSIPDDLGQDMAVILEATRGAGSVSRSTYHDFRIAGPVAAQVLGQFPSMMDGLAVGAAASVHDLDIQGMHAGINAVEDHWRLRDVTSTKNGYGIYYGPYSYLGGHQMIEDSVLIGNTVSSIAVSATNSIDQNLFKNIHVGYGPYGILFEAAPSNVTHSSGNLTNSVFDLAAVEAVGNAWIYGPGRIGNVVGNTFIGGGYADVGGQNAVYGLPNGTGGTAPAPAVVYAGAFQNNTMIGTRWGAYAFVADGIVEVAGSVSGNDWVNDPSFVFNATSTVPPYVFGDRGYNNRFHTAQGDGQFRYFATAAAPGVAVGEAGAAQALPYQDGKMFAGFTASPAVANHHAAVITSSDSVLSVVKADPNQAIAQGQPLFVTGGGVVGGLDAAHAIGTATLASGPGASTVSVTMGLGGQAGSPGAATGLTASNAAVPQSLTSALSQFTSVAPGAAVQLAIVPIGGAVTIINDGSNVLTVYPQAGGQIGSAAINAGLSILPGASAVFMRISPTLWHQ